MPSQLHSLVKNHLLRLWPSVREEAQLAKKLPRIDEDYYDLIKALYELWPTSGAYPEDNQGRWRTIDFYIANRHLLIEIDGEQHAHNGYRRDSFKYYPTDVGLSYDWRAVRDHCSTAKPQQSTSATSGWQRSRFFSHRDEERAFRDLVADVVAYRMGLKLIRILPWQLPRTFSTDRPYTDFLRIYIDHWSSHGQAAKSRYPRLALVNGG